MDWRNWCRLCGSYESLSKVDEIVLEITKKLEIGNDNIKVCLQCNNYMFDLYQFIERSRAMELMFLDLETTSSSIEYEDVELINNIRNRYGLKGLIDDKNTGLEHLFDSNITGALEIKIENEMEIPNVSESNPIDEKQFIEEETVENAESDVEEFIEFQEESEDSTNFKEENESASDFEQEVEKKRRWKKTGQHENFEFTFECHVCKEEFTKMAHLTAHCSEQHDCQPEVICFCGKTLSTWKRLQIHRQKHFPEKFDYECAECKMVYKMKASYINHMKHKHGPNAKKFVCSQCARCFKDSRTLVAHEKTHLPADLKLVFPCQLCDKKFVNKNSLKSHIMSVHECLSLFTCEHCGKSFSSKSNLKSHLYSHTTLKNVICDVCSSCFKNMDSLRKHKKTHLEKSFECNICHNRYRNRNNLKAHMVVHSEDKPFQCTYCPNQYKRSKDLKCHLNLHTGERPHVCQFCNRSFINGSNCRKHKLKDHPSELAAFESVHGRGKSAAIALQTLKTP